jgi:hypothetical protein
MIGSRPLFLDSPYFVMEEDNWHLKEGAPAGIVEEFNQYMKQLHGEESIIEKPVKKSFTERIDDLLSGN